MSSLNLVPKPNWEVPSNQAEDPGDDSSNSEEEAELNPNVEFATKMIRSMKYFFLLSKCCGRFPLSHVRIEDGMYLFTYKYKSINFIIFWFTSCLIFLILTMVLLNIFLISFGIDHNSTIFPLGREEPIVQRGVRLRELVVLSRYLVVLIVFGTSLIQSVISTFIIIRRREYFANYFGFWTRSIQTIQIDVTKNIQRFSLILIISFLTFIVVFVLLYAVSITSSLKGCAVATGVVTYRLFNPTLLKPNNLNNHDFSLSPNLLYYEILGLALFIINLFWSNIFIFLYMIKSKMLRNAFAYWNGRVYAAVLRNEFTKTKKARTTFPLLFKDHCVLLDLMDGTNTLFAGILEAYFGLQVTSLLFELYFFVRILNVKGGHYLSEQAIDLYRFDYYSRRNDIIPAILILARSVVSLYLVAHISFDVSDEAKAGLEVIRRKSLVGRATDEELYFILSLFNSFTCHDAIEMSGGGFFGVNKEFWVGIIGVVCSLFVIMTHLKPVFDYSDRERRKEIGMFLYHLEGLDKCHWAPMRLKPGEVACSVDVFATNDTI